MRTVMMVLMLVSGTLLCMARDLSAPAPKIPGAKVETESAAKRIAFDNYIKKMNGNISATEAVREVAIVILGYDLGDFAQKGIQIWEARVTDNQALRAIIWVNPRSEKVHFLCGPWDEEAME